MNELFSGTFYLFVKFILFFISLLSINLYLKSNEYYYKIEEIVTEMSIDKKKKDTSYLLAKSIIKKIKKDNLDDDLYIKLLLVRLEEICIMFENDCIVPNKKLFDPIYIHSEIKKTHLNF